MVCSILYKYSFRMSALLLLMTQPVSNVAKIHSIITSGIIISSAPLQI